MNIDKLNIDSNFVNTYNLLVNKFLIYFNNVIESDVEPERGAFMALSIAVRIASKIAIAYDVDKEALIETFSNNYAIEEKMVKAKSKKVRKSPHN